MIQQLQLSDISKTQLEPLESFLNLLGALAIRFNAADEQEIFEPEPGSTPLWELCNLTIQFPETQNLQAVIDIIQPQFELMDEQIKIIDTADKNWQDHWQQFVEPKQYGGLWIVPSCFPPPDPSAINIQMDPGLAFGSGSHPTTQLCLTYLSQMDLNGKCVIDYGCGSGILAIAAHKLGARPVYAIDIDPQALIATKNNAELNGINKDFDVSAANASLRCDVLVANILLTPLLSLHDQLINHLNPDSELILSGILREQQDQIIDQYGQSLSVKALSYQEEWLCISFSKR